MTERHTELLEIDFGQLRQDIGVDFIRAKERLVLSEAETSEPTPDIHVRAPRTPNRSSFGCSALSRTGLLKNWVGSRSANGTAGLKVSFGARADEKPDRLPRIR